ncbi:methyl-accepting chemotaxis protein [Paraburkholderia aspalathi]|uniref:Methyl-accepting chemotaxis protein n=1 Tax=Paraburkholderia aspalathi TaxID=1324617 RepID=A0A1I7EPR2_9BURK|nr:methyl-accepting chemotaxis protein [Paraburkholderia aspalathi]SFU25909.1 methyl-accepting chemotaxis protein [Paraburkholderia aspalathi]
MTISRRLILTLTIAFLALILVGLNGLWRLNQAQQRFEYVQVNIIPSIEELIGARGDASNLTQLSYRHLLTADSALKSSIEQAMAALDSSFDGHIATYERDDISDDNDRKLLAADKAAMATYRSARQNFLDKSRAGDVEGAKPILLDGGALSSASNALKETLMHHVEYNNKLSQGVRDENNVAYSQAFWLLISSILAALVVSGGSGIQLYRLITAGLNRIQQTLQHVSQSLDLTNAAPVERMDEIGHTAAAFNALLGRVAEVIGEVRRSAGSVSVASQQIAQGNTDLSQRTEEQATSLEETASSMEELTSTVRHNTDNARQATTLANTASENARRGGEVVGRVVETMQGISGGSAKMSEIISVIEGIAFQTNILALNAAVEAARAGEQGRGFAVVAGEVRTLAQRSATAAKEIKDLINESVSRVNAGSKLVEEAGSTINEIVQSVQRVTDIVGEISSASEEQSSGIEQVNQAVSQMDQVTQQNAALVEEAAAAAQSMAQQAQGLRDAVAIFRIADTGPSASRVVIPQSEPNRPAPAVRAPSRTATAKMTPLSTAARSTVVAPDATAVDWQAF